MGGWIHRGWVWRFWVASRGPKILILKGFGTSALKIGAPQKRQIQPRRIQPPDSQPSDTEVPTQQDVASMLDAPGPAPTLVCTKVVLPQALLRQEKWAD